MSGAIRRDAKSEIDTIRARIVSERHGRPPALFEGFAQDIQGGIPVGA
jgi:hypothetical protein